MSRTLVDSRLVTVDWAVTNGVTASLPVSFIDDNDDALPVDTWTFTATLYPTIGATGTALTVDTSQASTGAVTVTVDDSVSTAAGNGRMAWSLVWTVAGEPSGGLTGNLTIHPKGSRGAPGLDVNP